MNRLGSSLVAAAALIGVLTACEAEVASGTNSPATRGSAPTRVLPTNATAVDIVFDLVGPERVVAVPDTVADYATVALDLEYWKGDRVFAELSAEVLLALDPDLVVVSPWQDQGTIDRLVESGIEVMELPPVSELDDIREAIKMTGAALHAEEQAAELLTDFNARVAKLEKAAQANEKVTGLVYTNYGSGGWTAGSGTTAHHLLELAGVENVAATAGRVGHDGVDIETLLDMDPYILVISKPSRDYGVTRAYLEGEKALASLEAIAEDRIIELPSGLFSTASHHVLDAAELLAREVGALRTRAAK